MKEIESKIYEALGAASMCWSEVPSGIFDSHRAQQIGEKLIEEININNEKTKKLEAVADIISRIFYYGDFEIETPNERTLAGLLNDLGLFPTTEDEIIKRPEQEEYFQQYKSYTLKKNKNE